MAAIEVFPDSRSRDKSPRISFSYDLSQTDTLPIKSSPSSSNDFNFCAFCSSFDQESSSADELFSGGKILPFQIKKTLTLSRISDEPPPPPLQLHKTTKKKIISNERLGPNSSESEEKEKSHREPSFWSFNRSTSSSCYARGLCLLPSFARCYSTGSGRRSSISDYQKHSVFKCSPIGSCTAKSYQLRPLLKKNHNSFQYGIKVSPVLNISMANTFGFGYIFAGGNDKRKKK